MIANDGRRTNGISEKDTGKDRKYIHNGSISYYTVFSGDTQELIVINHVHNRGREACHHFGGTVGAGVQQNLSVEACSGQAKEAAVLSGKVNKGANTADDLTNCGGVTVSVTGLAAPCCFLRDVPPETPY